MSRAQLCNGQTSSIRENAHAATSYGCASHLCGLAEVLFVMAWHQPLPQLQQLGACGSPFGGHMQRHICCPHIALLIHCDHVRQEKLPSTPLAQHLPCTPIQLGLVLRPTFRNDRRPGQIQHTAQQSSATLHVSMHSLHTPRSSFDEPARRKLRTLMYNRNDRMIKASCHTPDS